MLQFAMLFVLARCCLAHTTGLSTSDFKFATNELSLDVVMAEADLALALAHMETANPIDANHDGKLTVEEIAAAMDRLRTFAAGAMAVAFDGQEVRPGPARFSVDDANNFHMTMSYTGKRPKRVRVRAALFEQLPPDHYHFTAIHEADGKSIGNKMLTPADDTLELQVATDDAPAAANAAPGLSTSDFKFATNGLSLNVVMAEADLKLALAHLATTSSIDANQDGKLTAEEIAAAMDQLRTLAAGAMVVEFDGQLVPPGPAKFSTDSARNFHMIMSYQGERPKRLRVRLALFEHLPPDHHHFTAIHGLDGKTITNKTLTTADNALEFEVARDSTQAAAKSAPRASTLADFLKLGILHIWTGYDHLLFLLALLLVCGTFKSAVQVISFFTVANTLTLALAALDLVWVAGRVVEVAIATSIIYVSVENILRPGGPKARWLVTFSFGLVHGLGFATVLRNLGVAATATGITVPLVGFNLGVEAGQIVVAAAVLPILWKLRTSKQFVRLGVPIGSGLLAAAGAYWLIERLFFK